MRIRIIAALFAALLLCSCGAQPTTAGGREQPESSLTESAAQEQNNLGFGEFQDDLQELAPEMKALALDYMDLYYESLAGLALCDKDELSALFAAGAQAQALGNYTVWDYLIRVRSMQRTDLSLAAYKYSLRCRNRETQEDGSVRLTVIENSTQNFAAHPDVDSDCLKVYHSFTFVQEEGRWRLSAHMQLDSLYFVLFGNAQESDLMTAFQDPRFPEENAESFFPQRLTELLAQAEENMQARLAAVEALPTKTDHPYDGGVAVAYARAYSEERNQEWPDYGEYGGNCQNYVSQCLLASGIPMDPYGPYLWKWYGTTPDNKAGAYGRSASWAAVEPFHDYVKNNVGFGLSGQADAQYYSGAEGDVIHLGPQDFWKHTVIITELVKDAKGNTVDYLICSNTADLRDFPVGAYAYTRQSLVRIFGWNEA